MCQPKLAISSQTAISGRVHRPVGWLLAAGCWLLLQYVAHACPACKESLFDPSQLHQKLSTARAYALSIGVMLAVPTCLIAGITMLIVRSIRRAKHTPNASPPQ